MLDDFLIRAALAGAAVAMVAGPLGSFVIWRRMAYFGDATAHAAVLGVALALAFDASVFAGTLIVALAMAVTAVRLTGRGHAMDAILGVLSHSALAIGLVSISLVPAVRVDLTAWLFGDILSVSKTDLAMIWAAAIAALAILVWRWRPLLTVTLNPELAAASGINARREDLALTLALALIVALALKVVGALLIAAMLIIPAAAARGVARSPEGMAVWATIAGLASVALGLRASLEFDTPAGPSIVSVAACLFVVSLVLAPMLRARRSHGQ